MGSTKLQDGESRGHGKCRRRRGRGDVREDEDSSDERQKGRKGDKQAAADAAIVMDRAARCSQPATRNVGDPAKGCCVRIRVGYPRYE